MRRSERDDSRRTRSDLLPLQRSDCLDELMGTGRRIKPGLVGDPLCEPSDVAPCASNPAVGAHLGGVRTVAGPGEENEGRVLVCEALRESVGLGCLLACMDFGFEDY